jgi:hypothetical protein
MEKKMKKSSIKTIYAVILSFFFIVNCFSFGDIEIQKIFKKKDNVKISFISAECTLKKSKTDEIIIKITHTYDSMNYNPIFSETSDELSIKEEFKESGKAKWLIEIPDKTGITFNSTSGKLIAEEMKCKFEIDTKSGDIELSEITGDLNINTESGAIELSEISGEAKINSESGNVEISEISGEITVNTSSGKVSIEKPDSKVKATTGSGNIYIAKASNDILINSSSGNIKMKSIEAEVIIKVSSGDVYIGDMKGKLDISTTKGDIEISGLNPAKPAILNSKSGDITLKLEKQLSEDFSLATKSGDVVLNFDGNATDGYFEIRIAKNPAVIEVPPDFQMVTSKADESNTEQIYKSGTGKPKVTINMESGELKIKK